MGLHDRQLKEYFMEQTNVKKITVYCGWQRDTEVRAQTEIVSGIAFKMPCFECGGSGVWNYYPDEDENGCLCVSCKGTGVQYVGI